MPDFFSSDGACFGVATPTIEETPYEKALSQNRRSARRPRKVKIRRRSMYGIRETVVEIINKPAPYKQNFRTHSLLEPTQKSRIEGTLSLKGGRK